MNTTLEALATELTAAQATEAAAVAALSIKKNAPTIAVINASTVVSDTDAEAATAAMQIQVSRDFVPAWGLDAKLVFVPKGGKAPAGSWQVALLDNSDQAGALGYHDWTIEGLPIGKVFANTDIDAGTSWTTTFSHEVLELRADPDIVRCVFIESTSGGGRLYALETSDAPEDDQFGYKINGILLSDFVYPSWFEPSWQPNSVQFDFGKHITQPFQLLPGGYISYYDVGTGNGWQQLTADLQPNRKARAPIGSRRERRRTPRSQWQRSTL